MPRPPRTRRILATLCLLAATGILGLRLALPASPARPITQTAPGKAGQTPTASPANPQSDPDDPLDRLAPDEHFLTDIPQGRLRQALFAADEPARLRALSTLARLRVPPEDHASLHVTPAGDLFYACSLGHAHAPPADSPASAPALATLAAPVPITHPPIRHSRPGSTKVLHLDFNGHTVTGTRWNAQNGGASTYQARPYDIDGDPATFGEAEQAVILQTWERVSEDFAPFDIDVTTEEPAVFTPTTARALVTPSVDANGLPLPASGAGGVAFFDVFGDPDYVAASSPVFIYTRSHAGEIADAISHEFGHNLGLSHDGQNGSEYYTGHGAGPTSWGPLMGTCYARNLGQWSKGEYLQANNPEDDLAILAALLGHRPDEAGDTTTTSAIPLVNEGAVSLDGVLAHSADSDLYTFTTSAGPIAFTATTYQAASGTRGGNLDVRLELLDATGALLATANPADNPDATLRHEATAGTYHLRLSPSGAGTPLASPPTGYTSYGSAGRYSLAGAIHPAPPAILGPVSAVIPAGQSSPFAIKATNTPALYSASGLPPGLGIDPATGLIDGVSTALGTFSITLRASNQLGSNTATFTLTIADARPVILDQTDGALLVAPGASPRLTVTARSLNGAPAYRWTRNGVAVPGATGPTLDLAPAAYAHAGRYQVLVTNSIGATASRSVFLSVIPSAPRLLAWGTGAHLAPPSTSTRLELIAVSAGSAHTLGLKRDRTVLAWGSDSLGQSSVPAGLATVVAIAAGNNHSLALKADGTVLAWGYNGSQQTSVPGNLADVVAIAAGNSHSLALRADGAVVSWGAPSSIPPANLSAVTAIAAGANHSLALKSDGTVVAWGNNASAQLSIPAGLTKVTAIAAGANHSLALKSDGTVVAWGSNTSGQTSVPAGLTKVTALAAGASHSLALKTDGTLLAWGSNTAGQTTPPVAFSPFFAISAGADRSYALHDPTGVRPPTISAHPRGRSTAEGATVTLEVAADGGTAPLSYQWRHKTVPLPRQTGPSLVLASITPAQAGAYDVVVTNRLGSITSDPATITLDASLPVISAFSPVRSSIPPGQPLSLSVVATGTGPLAYQWYRDGRPIVGATGPDHTPTTTATYSDSGAYWVTVTDPVGTRHSPVSFVTITPPLTALAAWGGDPDGVLTLPPGLDHTTSLSARFSHVLALQADGTVRAWGNNSHGQTTLPADLSEVVAVSAAARHSLALKADGTLVAWGDNTLGQTTLPFGLADLVALATGEYHSLALKRDGTVHAWGSDSSAQTTVPAGLSGVVAVAAGNHHSLALKADGTVVAWGYNSHGQTTVPPGLSGVVAIAAGYYHSLALKTDGTLVAWGSSSYANPPVGLNKLRAIAAGDTHSLAIKTDGTVVAWGLDTSGQSSPPPGLGAVFTGTAGNNFTLTARDAAGDDIPRITTHPQNKNAPEGADVTLSVAATAGTAPLSYQWRRDTVPLPGKTGATLRLPAITRDQAGDYDVVVTSRLGSTTSDPASVRLHDLKPRISAFSPARQHLPPGHPLRLEVVATGSGPISYQWYHDGRPVAGATGPTHARSSATLADSGAYWVLVSNPVASLRSPVAFVTVAPAYSILSTWQPTLANLRYTPEQIVRISIRDTTVLALRDNGTVVAIPGQTTTPGMSVPAGLAEVVALAAGVSTSLALKADGTVVAWGASTTLPAGLSDIVGIAVGDSTLGGSLIHFLALRRDGTVVAWGNNTRGQTTVPPGLSGVVAVAAGNAYSLALKADGTVVAWGFSDSGRTSVPAGLSGVTAIAAGLNHSLALKSDGTVVAWGSTASGKSTVPAGLSGVVALAAGVNHSLALKADGSVVVWGNGKSTVPAGLRDVFAIGAGTDTSYLLRPGVNSLEAFQALHFTPTQSADPAVGSATADPDSDGLPNLLEHAFELDPNTPDAALASPSISMGADGTLSLAYERNLDATDLLYTVQVSANLATWQSGLRATQTVSTTPLGLTRERIVVRDLAPSSPTSPRFIRLLVTKITALPPR